jgi:hypothetical protein
MGFLDRTIKCNKIEADVKCKAEICFDNENK